jgi:hypothetical protein
MKQIIKTNLVLLLTLLVLTSCTNEDIQNDKIIDKPVESIQNRINTQFLIVNELNSNYEKQLNNDFFKDVNSKELLEKVNSKQINETVISNKEVINSLVKYHYKRLLNIKKIRKKLGFISIQSIADEINSLKILDKELSNKLFEENSNFLVNGNFQVLPKLSNDLAMITDKEGYIYNVKDAGKMNFNTLDNTQNRVVNRHLSEDILVQNGLYAVTWHAKYSEKGGIYLDFSNKFKIETQINTYINFNGTYVLFPSLISISDNSFFAFFKNNLWLTQDMKTLKFASGMWVTGTSEVFTSGTNSYHSLRDGYINGNFATVLNNQVLLLSANKVVN